MVAPPADVHKGRPHRKSEWWYEHTRWIISTHTPCSGNDHMLRSLWTVYVFESWQVSSYIWYPLFPEPCKWFWLALFIYTIYSQDFSKSINTGKSCVTNLYQHKPDRSLNLSWWSKKIWISVFFIFFFLFYSMQNIKRRISHRVEYDDFNLFDNIISGLHYLKTLLKESPRLQHQKRNKHVSS